MPNRAGAYSAIRRNLEGVRA